MSKIIAFSDLGYPMMELPGLPPNQIIVPDGTVMVREDGQVLAPDGSYRWWLLGQPAFGGADGRQSTIVPDEPGMIGKSWADLAALKSEEHPFGLLKEARPETAAEKKAREKAEADAKAAEDAAAKAQADAAEKARIANLSVPLFSLRKVFRGTKAADGATYLEKLEAARAAGAISDDAYEAITMLDPVRRSSPYVTEVQAAFGFTDDEVTAIFIAASQVPV